MRLTILGGGGFRVPLIHRALLARPELGIDELVLYDTDAQRLGVIAEVLGQSDQVSVRTSISLPNSLHGADFVFSAVRVGGAAGRVRDERCALQQGVLGQETVGAGGLTYALRTLPVVLQMAQTLKEVAPEAFLINFTNPAGLITEALRGVLGNRVIGICDSPTALVARACRALGVSAAEVTPDYVGINHLGWLRKLTYQGRDLLPGLLADDALLASFEEGRLFGPDLLRELGAIPNEYLYFFYRQRELVQELRSSPTRGEVVRDQQDRFYSEAVVDRPQARELWSRTYAEREETYLAEAREGPRDHDDLSGGGYERVALDVIAAISGQRPARLIVNVANGATIAALPAELVIEVGCELQSGSVTPGAVEPLTLHQLGLIASVRSCEQAVIEAVITGSRSLARWALASHPLVNSAVVADALLQELLATEPGLADLLR